MFGLWRAWRRRRLAARPFPAAWEPILRQHYPAMAALPAERAERLRDNLKVFAWEKHWIGAHGLEVTDEMKVVISAAAARMIDGLSLSAYDRLTELVIYPSHYVHPDGEGGVVFGEAHRWGVVVLSWDAVKHGIGNPKDGHDTAMHEFAHVLDNADGAFDGTPPLHEAADYHAWAKVCTEHFLKLSRSPAKSVVRRYGATNEAEFFACATEAFFEKPRQLEKKAPDLYAVLQDYYRIDPARTRS